MLRFPDWATVLMTIQLTDMKGMQNLPLKAGFTVSLAVLSMISTQISHTNLSLNLT